MGSACAWLGSQSLPDAARPPRAAELTGLAAQPRDPSARAQPFPGSAPGVSSRAWLESAESDGCRLAAFVSVYPSALRLHDGDETSPVDFSFLRYVVVA